MVCAFRLPSINFGNRLGYQFVAGKLNRSHKSLIAGLLVGT